MATPGGFLRGDSPSPARAGSMGPGSSGPRVPLGEREQVWPRLWWKREATNDLMGEAVAEGGPALPVLTRNGHACLGPLLCLCPSHHPLLPSTPTPTVSLMKEDLGRPRGGRRKMEALEPSLNCSRS